MSDRPTSLRRLVPGIARWTIPGVLAILAPKCLGCLAAYAAIAAGLGLGGREICGGGLSHPSGISLWLACALSAVWLAAFAVRQLTPTRRQEAGGRQSGSRKPGAL